MSDREARVQQRAQLLAARDAAAVAARVAAEAAAEAAVSRAPPGGALGAAGDVGPVMAALQTLLRQQAAQAAATLAQQELARVAAELAAVEAQATATAALAQQRRAGAGQPPTFRGQTRSIEVHTWLNSLERWFDNAHIAADDERIEAAVAALRDTAQAWWTARLAVGGAAIPTTWVAFKAECSAHFLPQAPERWALQKLSELTQSRTANVAEYTNRFTELYTLLPLTPGDRIGELQRVAQYEQGLPEKFRLECAKKQHPTLAQATDATLAYWNAACAASGGPTGVSTRATTSLVHMEDDSMVDVHAAPTNAPGGATTSTQSGAPNTTSIESRMAAIERLCTALAERAPTREGGGSRNRRGGRANGTPRGRSQQREGVRSRSRSPHIPGLSKELVAERITKGVCIRCGEDGHFKDECTNQPKLGE